MLIKDKLYPFRCIVNYANTGLTIQFKDHIADVPDKVAAELIQTGDYEFVNKDNSDRSTLFPFRPDSWTKERKIVFDTAIGGMNGYGKSGMFIAEALGKTIDTYVMCNNWIGYDGQGMSPYLNELISKRLDTIDTFYIQYWPAFNFRPIAKRQVGYTMLECSRIPQSWVDNIKRSCERVIVPSIDQKIAFEESGIDMDIEVIHLGCDSSMFPYLERKREKNDTDYVFGIMGTLTFRKGVDIAINAFKLSFPIEKYPTVRLYVKTMPGIATYFYDLMKDDPRIALIVEGWNHDQLMSEFFDKIDCYVMPSRGEGWGMTVTEAMMTGLPVIATECSGIRDQMGEKYSYPVKTKIVDVPNKNPDGTRNFYGYPPELQAEGQTWWECSTEDFAQRMLEVYNDQKMAKKKGKLASQFAHKNFNHLDTAKKIVNYLDRKF